ncbi:MAG: Crp/Fnr family transcriptional regulator [Opitutaceae bacterium]|nr:Crp/Fnr family transcriptional regulator [Opitutaceae bacterium]
MALDPAQRETIRQAALAGVLRRCQLFEDLPEPDLMAVASACTVRALAKGEYLFREGQPAEGFYVIQTGVVNVHRITPDGREQVICFFRPYESFAEATLVTIDTYPAHAVATEPSQVIVVRRQEFRDLIARRPELALRMLSSMSQHLKHLVQLLQNLKGRQIEARLADWLLEHAPACPAHDQEAVLELPVSKKVLAGQLGVTSETLSRTLARFRDEGSIVVDGKRITLRDPARLRAWVAG